MNKKITGIVSYLTLVGWLIAFLAGDKEGAKFHLNQSLVLVLANIIMSIFSTVLGGVFIIGILLGVVNIVLFAFWILGLVYAIKEEEKELPFIGQIKILK